MLSDWHGLPWSDQRGLVELAGWLAKASRRPVRRLQPVSEDCPAPIGRFDGEAGQAKCSDPSCDRLRGRCTAHRPRTRSLAPVGLARRSKAAAGDCEGAAEHEAGATGRGCEASLEEVHGNTRKKGKARLVRLLEPWQRRRSLQYRATGSEYARYQQPTDARYGGAR
eukprot:scaffold82_cov366-Pavlova_lutheri.AAC.3